MSVNYNDAIYNPKLGPNKNLLLDRKLLSQAWKKTNIFIRENNWYVDRLELDLYSFNIENNLKKISELNTRYIDKNFNEDSDISSFNIVPVPKSTVENWEFTNEDANLNFDSWSSPECTNENTLLELRGIALADMKTQINFTAILMCIAEAMESLQKRIKTDLADLLSADFYSYGNRLKSIWVNEEDNEKAIFQSGSSLLYEKYFHNYKLFLDRPLLIAEHYDSCLSSQHKIYILHMDISKFYDSIDKNLLKDFIQENLLKYYESSDTFKENDINDFTEILPNFFDFNYENSLNESILNPISGLPQGLSASGFLSNIYLMEFDEKIGEYKNKPIKFSADQAEISEDVSSTETIIIRDYCRYVDDMRLVIEVNKEIHEEIFKEKIIKIIEHLISSSINDRASSEYQIEFNHHKTEVIDYNKYYRKTISQTLNSHRLLASGTPTLEDISQNLDSLKNLLLSSLNSYKEEHSNKLMLSKISTEKWDIKSSTVRKFLATEFKKNIDIKNSVLKGSLERNSYMDKNNNLLHAEKKTISKLLLYTWSKDPSLIYLLKIGLEIDPSLFNFKSILEILETKLKYPPTDETPKSLREREVAFYTIGQIYDLGCNLNFKENNENNQINKYSCMNKLLFNFAEKILNFHKNEVCKLPFYVLQNLIIFYNFMNPSKFDYLIDNTDKIEYLRMQPYILLSHIPESINAENNSKYIDILALALIKNQLTNDQDFTFMNWFIKFINTVQNIEIKKELIKKLFQENNKLFRKIFSENCTTIEFRNYSELIKPYEFYLETYKSSSNILLKNNKPISLMKIILSKENPFNQENALLLLTRNLLTKIDSNSSILDIDVECSNWEYIQNPQFYTDTFFKVELNTNQSNNKLDINPFWLDSQNSSLPEALALPLTHFKRLYKIGMILRSCILNTFHFTALELNDERKKEFGFRTTYYSRTFGLNNTTSKLSNKINPITPWLSEFIFYCLRWPYAHFDEEESIKYKDVFKLINQRISYQKEIYGKMTDTPMYVYPINFNEKNTTESLKVGIVQSILPKPSDFDEKNPLYWSDENRSIQRNHIVNICNLIERHLTAYNKSNQEQYIDLLVFPEVSVHMDDIDILKKLVRKIKTNIFAGLMFMKNPKNSSEIINQAVWITHHTIDEREEILELYQGKKNPTSNEIKKGIKSYRPYQLIMEFTHSNGVTWKTTGSICYDSTDLKLAADLRDLTDSYIISAYNKDVQTFDNMASSLSYHMYQPIILSNIGVYGGSTIQAPFSEHNKLVAHLHGNNQIGIGIFEIDMKDFKTIERKVDRKKTKTPPAGYIGRLL